MKKIRHITGVLFFMIILVSGMAMPAMGYTSGDFTYSVKDNKRRRRAVGKSILK